jgi:hypothetical protein
MPTSVNKRNKERDRQERQRNKDERRKEKRQERANKPDRASDEDPDLAGIVPGPQPVEETFE